MKFTRSMVLVSNDAESLRKGAGEIFRNFQQELEAYGLKDEISLAQFTDGGRSDSLPMVMIYPEASAYGPIRPEDVKRIVEEHLYKGRVVEDLVAPVKELSGRIGWLKARKGALPMEKRIVLRRAGRIDPENIEEYIARDGYAAAIGHLEQALRPGGPVGAIARIDRFKRMHSF